MESSFLTVIWDPSRMWSFVIPALTGLKMKEDTTHTTWGPGPASGSPTYAEPAYGSPSDAGPAYGSPTDAGGKSMETEKAESTQHIVDAQLKWALLGGLHQVGQVPGAWVLC